MKNRQIKVWCQIPFTTRYSNFSEMNHNTVFENRPKSSFKVPKMDDFGELLKTSSLRSKSVTRQVTLNKKSKCDILEHCAQSKVQNQFCFALFIEKCVWISVLFYVWNLQLSRKQSRMQHRFSQGICIIIIQRGCG